LVELTVFFLDEIHRFNKAQQDALLPRSRRARDLIGATTENPYFEVNSALPRAVRSTQLRAPLASDIEVVLRRAVRRSGRGRRRRIAFLAARGRRRANGAGRVFDPRRSDPRPSRSRRRSRPAAPRRPRDKTGDRHYDTISA
jgi:putative ATPase